MTNQQTIVVTGATGQQGGATARHLANAGWRVRALTRNPNKPAAQALAKSGMEVVQGDLQDRTSLSEVLDGAYGVFSVQNPQEHGPDGELTQGKLLAEVAQEVGVKHFVYSSSGGAERQSGLPHVESKWQIEQHVRSLNLPATILRPTFFMDNFAWPDFRAAIQSGTLMIGIALNTRVQMIAADDIGAFVALAFAQPDKFIGQALEIAGDEVTMPGAAEVFAHVIGKPVQYIEQPLEEVAAFSPELAAIYRWFNEKGNQADLTSLRVIHPELMTLEAWLIRTGWENAVRDEHELTSSQLLQS